MTVRLATGTLAAIEAALVKDQGAAFRGYLKEAILSVEDAYRSTPEDDYRSHLGASLIGRECDRQLWYGFRWAATKKFDGRILRLFNRGHMEEARFIALMRTIGCTVYAQNPDGSQYRISDHGGHFGSAVDSVIVGLPDIPYGEPAVGEYKTHGDSSFKKLVSSGVLKAKPEHYTQTQVYMKKMGTKHGIYIAVNKNDDSLYAEILTLDHIADLAIERAGNIIYSAEAPDRVHNASPAWFACKWCDFSSVCFGKRAPDRNCRTCRHSAPAPDGTWECHEPSAVAAFHSPVVLDKKSQLAGCPNYSANPSFV